MQQVTLITKIKAIQILLTLLALLVVNHTSIVPPSFNRANLHFRNFISSIATNQFRIALFKFVQRIV